MKRNPCICCGSPAIGYVFFVGNQICRVCRDSVLTFLHQQKIIMSDQHPFIAELCEDSHALPDACWTYHNSVLSTRASVVRLTKYAKFDSEINSASELDILDGL